MELVALTLVPFAITLLVRVVRAVRTPAPPPTPPPPSPPRRPDAVESPPASSYTPPTFRVVALGTSGCGKTVFLSSLFHKLNYRAPGRSYYLETDAKRRVALGRIYSTVSDTAKPWPRGTRVGETREFVFDCVGVDDSDTRHTVLHLSYLDYAGELLEVEQEPGGTALDDLADRIANAHALLGMIDGHRVLQLLKGERGGHEYFQHSLQPMLGFMQGASCPIHLILTKWDLVRDFAASSETEEGALLERVIQALMGYEHLKSLVYVHSRKQIVRLIPVSAVGSSFVDLDADGRVVKRSGGELRPTNVEVPLCAVLPDVFRQVEMSLDASVRRGVNAAMLRQLRKDAGALAATVLAGRAGAALRAVLQGALGRDIGDEASTLFVEWLAGPSTDDGALGGKRRDLEERIADVQRVRARVMEDFRTTVLRLEAVLPNSELSERW